MIISNYFTTKIKLRGKLYPGPMSLTEEFLCESLGRFLKIFLKWFLIVIRLLRGAVDKKKKNLSMQEMQETQFWFLGWEDPLEEEIAIHPSILAWKIPWTEEPGRSMGSQRVRHNWAHMYTQGALIKFTILTILSMQFISVFTLIDFCTSNLQNFFVLASKTENLRPLSISSFSPLHNLWQPSFYFLSLYIWVLMFLR